MTFRDSLSGWLSVILKMMLVCLAVVFGIWFILCIWGNVAETRAESEPTMPSISKARYEFLIGNTGQTVLTPKYTKDGTAYYLQGYYELKDNRWLWRRNTLTLDEKYFGPIVVSLRE